MESPRPKTQAGTVGNNTSGWSKSASDNVCSVFKRNLFCLWVGKQMESPHSHDCQKVMCLVIKLSFLYLNVKLGQEDQQSIVMWTPIV